MKNQTKKRRRGIPFITYSARDAQSIHERFEGVHVKCLSLDDIADSLSVRNQDGSPMSPGERMQSQAVFLADRIAGNSRISEYNAYNIAWRVLKNESEQDIPYLRMWEKVQGLGINVLDRFRQSDLKVELLVRLFGDKFGKGKKQDLSYESFERKKARVGDGGNLSVRYDAYVGTVFRGVFRGAEKRAKEYGLSR